MSGTAGRFRLIGWTGLVFIGACMLFGWMIGRQPARNASGPPISLRTADSTFGASLREARTPLGSETAPSTVPAGSVRGMTEIESPSPASARERKVDEEPSGPFSQWTTLENAFEESRRTGKPVLIDFTADSCGPCQKLKQEVFDQSSRGQVVQMSVIPVSIVDLARAGGSNPPEVDNLMQRFRVEVIPTLVIFSPQTGRGAKAPGFTDADQTLDWIRDVSKMARLRDGVHE